MDCHVAALLSMNRLLLLAVGCGLLVGRTSVRHGRLKSTLRLHGRLKQTPGSRDVCGIGRIRAARNDGWRGNRCRPARMTLWKCRLVTHQVELCLRVTPE